jgi:plasmid maintenance system antidote protein VapI
MRITTPQPAEVFHPGEYLADELDERHWTAETLEAATGIAEIRWANVLNKSRCLLASEAEALERIGWGSAIMWLTLGRRWKTAPTSRRAR